MLVSLGKEADVNLNVRLYVRCHVQTIRECVNTATVSLRNLNQTRAVMEIPKCKTLSPDKVASTMADVSLPPSLQSRSSSAATTSPTTASTSPPRTSRERC